MQKKTPESLSTQLAALAQEGRLAAAAASRTWQQHAEWFQAALADLRAGLHETETRSVEGLLTLASHGWYLPLSAPWTAPARLASSPPANAEDLHDLLEDRWRLDFDQSASQLLIDNPTRADILSEACGAHRQGLFYLSTAVFFTQAEGVCQDLAGCKLFSKQGGATQLEGVRARQDRLLAVALAPLATIQPIVWGSGRCREFPDALNRHEVLHGVDVGYGTERNSLKAFSLLAYVSWVLQHVAQEPD